MPMPEDKLNDFVFLFRILLFWMNEPTHLSKGGWKSAKQRIAFGKLWCVPSVYYNIKSIQNADRSILHVPQSDISLCAHI